MDFVNDFVPQIFCRAYHSIKNGYVIHGDHIYDVNGYYTIPPITISNQFVKIDPLLPFVMGKKRGISIINDFLISYPYPANVISEWHYAMVNGNWPATYATSCNYDDLICSAWTIFKMRDIGHYHIKDKYVIHDMCAWKDKIPSKELKVKITSILDKLYKLPRLQY